MKAHKYKLKMNAKFQAGCEQALHVCRELYNAALQERRDAWAMSRTSVNYYQQASQLAVIKQAREDVAAVYSQVLQDTLRRLSKTFEAFFRRVRNGEQPGFPRFKGCDRFDSFCYPQSGFRLTGDKLHLSKIGSCRVRLSRPVEGTTRPARSGAKLMAGMSSL
jgi:putative transposase